MNSVRSAVSVAQVADASSSQDKSSKDKGKKKSDDNSTTEEAAGVSTKYNRYQYPQMTKTQGSFRLNVEAGFFTDSEIVVMLGENGTGKTTFIRMLAGLLPPDEEDIEIPEFNVSYKPQKIRCGRRSCGCVQRPHRTVSHLLLRPCPCPSAAPRARAPCATCTTRASASRISTRSSSQTSSSRSRSKTSTTKKSNICRAENFNAWRWGCAWGSRQTFTSSMSHRRIWIQNRGFSPPK